MIFSDLFTHIESPFNYYSIAGLWINYGSADDSIQLSGLSHLAEHLFLNSTNKLKNKSEVYRFIEGNGLFFNAYTDKDATFFYTIQEPNKIDMALNVLIDGIESFPHLSHLQLIDQEKQIIINEIERQVINPRTYVWTLADESIWPDTSFGLLGLGTEASIKKITKNNLEEYSNYMTNTSRINFIAIAPKKPSSQVLNMSILSKTKEDIPYDKVDLPISSNHVNSKFLQGSLAHIVFTIILKIKPSNYKEKVALELLRNYLASGWSSRFIELLRTENNLTYWVHSSLKFYKQASYLRFVYSTSIDSLAKSISIIKREFDQVLNVALSEELLQHHKNAMKSHFIRNIIQPENQVIWYGRNLFIDNQSFVPSDLMYTLQEITPKFFLDTIQKYIGMSNLFVTSLGPLSQNELIQKFEDHF